MDNLQYYPTPKWLAQKMIEPYKIDSNTRVIDICSGNGELSDVIKKNLGSWRPNIDCIEIDVNRQLVCDQKGYKIIDSDYNDYNGDGGAYDLYISNPPFRYGVKFLLKTFDLMRDTGGDICFLLNSECVTNPYTKERKLLLSIIDNYGEYEIIENAFIDAVRKTGVSVALVRLHVDKNERFVDINLEQDTDDSTWDSSYENVPTFNNKIDDMIASYNASVTRLKEMYNLYQEFTFYSGTDLGYFKSGYEHESLKLKEGYWDEIIKVLRDKYDFTSIYREEIESILKNTSCVSFNMTNIKRLIDSWDQSYQDIMNRTIKKIFEKITLYHKGNSNHTEGWVNNKSWYIGKKIILPHNDSYVTYDLVRDLEICISHVTNQPRDRDSSATKHVSFYYKDSDYDGKKDSQFFTVKLYKKGTIHLVWKDEDTRIMFNERCGKIINNSIGSGSY